MGDDAILYARDFQKMGAMNTVRGEPLNWAYGQLHSTLYELLGLPHGRRLGYWLGQVCDGRPAVDSNSRARNPKEGIKVQLRREDCPGPRGWPGFVVADLYGSSRR